ncbi:MAG TPA: YbhB/YbcL family Raf kinase inhibitor-like protein [Acidimicrobiia bacterium]|nr:YbhB/YbcL family Raf kinase inhibitor-like protein [Acidimicrobiia bacterium]
MKAAVGAGVVALLTIVGACGDDSPPGSDAAAELAARDLPEVLEVTSPAFADGTPVPPRFTCDGDDLAPPLAWSAVPTGTQSLAIVVDDPDASGGTFTHWVVTAIAADTGETVEGQSPGVQHENSFGVEEYRGPCPPTDDDAHTYRFTVYALDAPGDVCGSDGDDDSCPSPTTQESLEYIGEHVRAEGSLTGTYGR